jgi:hypothetical protein
VSISVCCNWRAISLNWCQCFQPIQTQFKNFGLVFFTTHAEQLKKTAVRQWSVVGKQLRDAIDKLCLVANDEGLLPPSAVEFFSTSCEYDSENLSFRHLHATVSANYATNDC